MNVYEEDARGKQAKELLENIMFREAIDTLRRSLVDKCTHNGFTWKVTGADGSGNNVWEPGVFGWTKET